MRASKDTIEAYIRRAFHYCPDSGRLTWKIPGGRWGIYPVGSQVGCINGLGYWQTAHGGATLLVHRVAWFLHTGAWPKGQLDHKDTDPSNNKFENLRDLTDHKNPQNQRRANKRNTLGVLGVSMTTSGRYVAKIKADGVRHHLGSFDTIGQAYEAYVEAKRRLHTACTL